MSRPSELTELIIAYGCAERELGIALGSHTTSEYLQCNASARELFQRIIGLLHEGETR